MCSFVFVKIDNFYETIELVVKTEGYLFFMECLFWNYSYKYCTQTFVFIRCQIEIINRTLETLDKACYSKYSEAASPLRLFFIFFEAWKLSYLFYQCLCYELYLALLIQPLDTYFSFSFILNMLYHQPTRKLGISL